ncbi:MAG: hypothetical protein AAGA76_10980 [Pseudomonadota bacterium]
MQGFSKMQSSDNNSLMGKRRECDGNAETSIYQNAKKLGFSPQEIKHLKRLYEGKLKPGTDIK